ncbi:hypothetical protein ABMA28_001879 [Loxostege sticticalis]|uniref:Endonuclease/exonuclease/phosphatase domain-containing protein n=1 Tax=Loxostege sticticalis TaxID=481309 RepID=A0ABD0SZ07_LOXSC
MEEEIEKGKVAYIRYDKLIVKEAPNEKRKRSPTQSPKTMPGTSESISTMAFNKQPSKKNKKREYINISTLNTRTLRTNESLMELEHALDQINWDIIGLSEVRRVGEIIEEHDKYIFYHIGKIPGMYGVGFLVKKCYREYIQEFIGVCDRIAQLNIHIPGFEPITIIQIYAPTEVSSEEVKDLFYDQLETTLENTHKTIFLMGDFNSQIGERQTNDKNVLGAFSTGKRNNNGQRLVDLAQAHHLKIMNSFFKKGKNKKWTWISPNGEVRNEIDYILTNKPQYVADVDTINKLNFNTNHRMLRSRIYIGKPKSKRKHIKPQTRPNVIPLPLPDELLIPVKNNLSLKMSKISDIQEKYDLLEEELKNLSEKLRYLKTTKDKIDDEEMVPPVLPSEVRKAILSQKSFKAPGDDNITNEIIKGSLDSILNAQIEVNGNPIEYVDQYTYLGQIISPVDQTQKEIETRIRSYEKPTVFNGREKEGVQYLYPTVYDLWLPNTENCGRH